MNIRRRSGFIQLAGLPLGGASVNQGDGTTGGFIVIDDGGNEAGSQPTTNYITFSEDGSGEAVTVV